METSLKIVLAIIGGVILGVVASFLTGDKNLGIVAGMLSCLIISQSK